jgi:uncharacterized protein
MHVAGLNATLAQNIITYRQQHGRFKSRQALTKVPRLGTKAFQQAAGFLTVNGGDECLDETILHPEQYALAKQLIAFNNISTQDLLINKDVSALTLPPFKVKDSQQESVIQAYQEIITVLSMTRRDPRDQFKVAEFDQNIHKVSDLEVDMLLQGVVTNVANFGAFVDLGVHQDGLVHISMLSDGFVNDPHKIVKVGQVVNVKITSIDQQRKRIALTMKNIKQP